MLDNLHEMRRAFFQLVGTVSTDAALIEQGEAVDEIAHRLITQGVRNAQQYIIDIGGGSRWRKTSAAIVWAGSDDTGGRYAVLPPDFLRLAADADNSAIRSPAGVPWGRLIDERDRFKHRGSAYYILDHEGEERLWLCVGASPPAGVVMDYFYAHDELALNGDPLDFPESDRPLALVEAAVLAIGESWFPGDQLAEHRLLNKQAGERRLCRSRIRRTRQHKKFRTRGGSGSHYFMRR